MVRYPPTSEKEALTVATISPNVRYKEKDSNGSKFAFEKCGDKRTLDALPPSIEQVLPILIYT